MATKTQIIPRGRDFQLDPNTFAKAGYRFLGWGETRETTEPNHSDKGTANFQNDTDLYAVWKRVAYNVIFHANGGTIGPDNQPEKEYTKNYGDAIEVPSASQVGHTFLNWQPTPPSTMPQSDLEFYAQWQINQYTATFDFKRTGTGYTDSTNIVKRTQNYGTQLVPPTTTWPGRKWEGWYRDGDSSTTVTVPATMPAENVKYNGKWAWETHYVYYKYADAATFGTDNIANPQEVSNGTVPANPTPPTR